jgi:hypothetical protein
VGVPGGETNHRRRKGRGRLGGESGMAGGEVGGTAGGRVGGTAGGRVDRTAGGGVGGMADGGVCSSRWRAWLVGGRESGDRALLGKQL